MIHNSRWSRHVDDFEIILTHKTSIANSLRIKKYKVLECDKVALYVPNSYYQMLLKFLTKFKKLTIQNDKFVDDVEMVEIYFIRFQMSIIV